MEAANYRFAAYEWAECAAACQRALRTFTARGKRSGVPAMAGLLCRLLYAEGDAAGAREVIALAKALKLGGAEASGAAAAATPSAASPPSASSASAEPPSASSASADPAKRKKKRTWPKPDLAAFDLFDKLAELADDRERQAYALHRLIFHAWASNALTYMSAENARALLERLQVVATGCLLSAS